MPALAPHDSSAMAVAAAEWLRRNPSVLVLQMDRPRRMADAGARATYSHLTKKVMQQRLGTLAGAVPEPCCHCGEWSHCFCEACNHEDGPPRAVCTTCDGARLVCTECMAKHRTWESANAERAARLGDLEHLMQVNGYNTEDGEYVTFDPPVMIDTRDLPPGDDGMLSMELVWERIQQAADARNAP